MFKKVSKKRFVKIMRTKYKKKDIQLCVDFIKQHNAFISYANLLIFLILNEGDINKTIDKLSNISVYASKIEISEGDSDEKI